MIKAKDCMVTDIKEKLRGGDGKAVLTHLFKPGEFDGKARLMARITLEPGCSIGFHEHLHEEEIFYVLSGEATIYESEGSPGTVAHAGDASIIKSGGGHAVRNNGAETLDMLALILLTE
jgi:quercetin dioxygenase-like cupin family protein